MATVKVIFQSLSPISPSQHFFKIILHYKHN